jgi:hypothetical protein
MTEIVLTPEQLSTLDSAEKMVTISRPDGSIVGLMALTPKHAVFTAEEIVAAERLAEADGPWYSTAEVLEHLRSLERS